MVSEVNEKPAQIDQASPHEAQHFADLVALSSSALFRTAFGEDFRSLMVALFREVNARTSLR